MKKEIKQYITFCITEGCSERCNDAQLEEDSPRQKTMLLKDFLKDHDEVAKRLKHKLETMNTHGDMSLSWIHEVFTRVLKG